MADTTMPPIPTRSPVIDGSNLLSVAWMGFFVKLVERVGGANAPSNSTIAAISNTISNQATKISSLQTQVSAISNQKAGLLTNGRQL